MFAHSHRRTNRVTKQEDEQRVQREATRLENLQMKQDSMFYFFFSMFCDGSNKTIDTAQEAKKAVEAAVKSELLAEAEDNTINFVDDDDETANAEEEYQLWKVCTFS